MTAAEMLRVFAARGYSPHWLGDASIRDALHEATHVVQSGARNWERESLHRAIERKARRDFSMLLRFELQARAVEMLGCERFGESYDIEHWAFVCWKETADTYRRDLGKIGTVVDAIKTVAEQRNTLTLLDRVLAMRAPKHNKEIR